MESCEQKYEQLLKRSQTTSGLDGDLLPRNITIAQVNIIESDTLSIIAFIFRVNIYQLRIRVFIYSPHLIFELLFFLLDPFKLF